MKLLILLSATSLIMCLPVLNAEGDTKDNHGTHEAHVHGEAEITLILQDDELAINFESPAVNLVGFEHQPENDQQRKVLDTALVDLRNPISWLQFDGSNCDLVSATVKTSLDSTHEQKGHAEFSAEYLFQCRQANNLNSLLVTLQSNYPSVEHINVQWIINGKQGATELEADNQRISFR